MQHYAAPLAAPVRAQVRGVLPAPESHKPVLSVASPWPPAGRVVRPLTTAAAQHSVIPAAVAAAPSPAVARAKHPLRDLPRFRPPDFEGADGTLPCPDSPGSTPRESPRASAAGGLGLPQAGAGTALVPSWVAGATPASAHAAAAEGGAEAANDVSLCKSPIPTASGAVPTPSGSSSVPEGLARPSPPLARAIGPLFSPGSIVEYKSRSSGQWILARVEGFDEGNQVYRLDVQPNARPERIRARAPVAVATHSVGTGTSGPEAAGGAEVPVATAAELTARGSHAPHNGMQDPSAPQPIASGASGRSAGGEDERRQLLQELAWHRAAREVLQEQLATETRLKDRYRAECKAMQEKLAQETSLKDRCLAELCACRKALEELQLQQRAAPEPDSQD